MVRTFLANFRELRQSEVRRTLLLRAGLNRERQRVFRLLLIAFCQLVGRGVSTLSLSRPLAVGSRSVRSMPASDTPRRPSSRRHSIRYSSSLVSRSPRISCIAFLTTSLFVVGFFNRSHP